MPSDIDPGMVELFGSAARVATLAALANAFEPMTGYRVARTTGVQPIKVYAELRRLSRAGVLRERVAESGGKAWEISDPDLRSFLRRRVRLSSSSDFFREREANPVDIGSYRRSLADLDLKQFTPTGWRPRFPEDFERPEEKDRVLARLGLRTSARRKRRP